MTDKRTRTQTGRVISSSRDKTITVLIERKVKHPQIRRSIAQLKTLNREQARENKNDG